MMMMLQRQDTKGERASLLPEMHHWDSNVPRRHHHRHHHGPGAQPDDGDDPCDGGLGRYSDESDEPSGGRRVGLRRDVWTVLRFRASVPHRSGLQRASYAFECCVLVLILLNVVLAMVASTTLANGGPTTASSYTNSDWYDIVLYVSTGIFSVEYLLRLWSCVEDERFSTVIFGRIKWMLRPMSIIDLIVLIPFFLEIYSKHHTLNASRGILTLRGLRLLRIMSFLRLERSYSAMKSLREIFTQKSEELWVVSYLTAVIVLTASTTMFFLENEAQPDVFSNLGVCAMWAIETITSLGYGDIVPVTAGGRFFSCVLALWGIVLFTIPGAVLSSGFVEVRLQKQEREHRRFEDELRLTFSRELRAVCSGGFKNGHFDIQCEIQGQSSPLPAVQPPLSEIQSLKEQIEILTKLQEQSQIQLRAQKHQLEKMNRLLEENARPSRLSEMPPFSEITVPTVRDE